MLQTRRAGISLRLQHTLDQSLVWSDRPASLQPSTACEGLADRPPRVNFGVSFSALG